METLSPVVAVPGLFGEARIVPEDARNGWLFRTFGSSSFFLEGMIYSAMGLLCDEYKGGMWDFVELPSGAGFMFPRMDAPMIRCHWNDNCSNEMVTPVAAGLVATTFGVNHLMFRTKQQAALELLSERYEMLRDYLCEHPEASAMLSLTD